MISGAEPHTIDDFSGGLDTKTNPLKIAKDKSPHVLNCHTNIRGALSARNGFAQLNGSVETGNANGLYDYPVNSTTRLLVQMRGTTMQKMDALDGTWDSITAAAAFSDNMLEFETFDLGTGSNRLVMASASGSDDMQYWDGSGSTVQITDADAGEPKYIKVWNQRLFGIGDADDPNNLRWSDAGSVTVWTTASNVDIITNDGDFVTGLGLLKKNLFVFKRYSIHRITFTGGDPLIEVSPIVSGTGCISSKTIKNVNIPEIGEALLFLSADNRIMAFTGHSEGLFNISDGISINNGVSPISMAQLNNANSGKSHAVVFPNKFWYICFVPSSGSTIPDYALVYDYLNKSWFPWSNMKFGASAQITTDNEIRVYGQGNAGSLRTHRLDSGNSDNGDGINRVYFTPRVYNQSSSVLSSSYGAQFTFKQIGNYDVGISHRLEWNTQWTTAVNLNMRSSDNVLGDVLPLILGGDESVVSHIDVPKLKNIIQYKVETSNANPPWILYRMEELSKARGIKP